MIHVAPRPAPVCAFDAAEDLDAILYHADTIARWTLACIDGDRMYDRTDEARAMALAATGDVLKQRAK